MAAEISFNDWVKALFAHPASDTNWQWDEDVVFKEPKGEQCVQFITKLFNETEHLEEYLEEQVNQGLNYLINPSLSNHMFTLYDQNVPLKMRLQCLSSFENLFKNYFAKFCSERLSHLDEQPCNAVNRVCYMWWDVIPLYGQPKDAEKCLLDPPILELMQRILAIDSIACQESALHGLGHWSSKYSHEVEKTIDAYLLKSPIRSELQAYASAARIGCVN